jgi:YVTN family beta-propeller protein
MAASNFFLVNVNPDANSYSLYLVYPAFFDTPIKMLEAPVGRDPSSIALSPNAYKAYVANSLDGTVSVVETFSGTTLNTIPVGAEPSAVALTPNGSRLYVANSSSNSLTVIRTDTDAVVTTIDLSPFGTAPRAIAITNDGDTDDEDETVFVALFFAQLRPGKSSVDEGQDDQRQGRVVAISAVTNMVLGTVNLEPQANTGFNANGKLAPAVGLTPAVASTNPQTFTTPTGAFPNQLAAIALHPSMNLAYVVSTGASPNGPVRFNVNNQGLVSVFNTSTRSEITSGQVGTDVRRTAPLNLNQGINLGTTPAPRLFLTNPVAMTWRPDGSDAWVVIQNSDLVVRLTIDKNGIPTVNNPLVAGPSTLVRVDLEANNGFIPGKAPRGLVINSLGDRAYVMNYVSRSISTIDISSDPPAVVGTTLATALPKPGSKEATVQLGKELFFTGRGPMGRMSSESWGGCITCHPNGRADNVTWMFAAGPRETVPLDGMFNKKNPADQRILNWSGIFDEGMDFELNTRGVFGGRGLIDDDRLFLAIGGASGAKPTDSALIEQFQNFTGAVTTTNELAGGATLPTLPSARRDFAVATLDDDRVFIIGGRSGAGQGSLVPLSSSVQVFDPRTNTLSAAGTSGFTPRHSLGAAAVKTNQGPRIYAIGGYDSTSATASPTNLVQEYNPATGTWRNVASLPTAVAQFGITKAGGINTAEPLELIHVTSGNVGSEATPFVPSSFVVQRFQADPAGAGTWSTFGVTSMTPRRNHGAATAIRGVTSRVFVIGGQNAAGTVLSTVEEYLAQAVTKVDTPHTSLPAPRARFGIGSTTTTNQIYVIGGTDGTADQTTVLQYTIADNGPVAGPAGTPSGAWVTRGNLSAAKRSLGVSNPPGVTAFLPAKNRGRDARQDAISAFMATIRSAKAPVAATDPAAMAGRTLFGTKGLVVPGFSCATCHGGQKWTRSIVDYVTPPSPTTGLGLGNEQVIGAELRRTATQPNTAGPVAPPQYPGVLLNVGTFTLGGGRVNEIRSNPADISQAIGPLGANGFNIPSLLSVHETSPYFYSGLAQTLEQVLNGSQDSFGGVRHHFVANATQRANLIAFLRSIDQTTPIFP